MDSEKKSRLADSAFYYAVQKGDICKQIELRVVQSSHLDKIGLIDSALTQLYWANKMFHKGCDSLLLMSIYRNLTNSFLSINDLKSIDSISHIAMDLWNPEWKEKETRFAILNNLAIAYIQMEKNDSATALFRQVYNEAKIVNDENHILKELINLGSIKGMIEDLDSAYYFFSLAADHAKSHSDATDYMALLINLAKLDMERGNLSPAISLLDSVYEMAEEKKNTETMLNAEWLRSRVYDKMGRYKLAFQHLNDYSLMRDEYLDEERVKAVAEMMEKYESEKKARQIQQLEVDKLDAALTNEKVTNTKNRLLYVGIGILLLSVALISRLRYVQKSRQAIRKEKDISEGLLLNILPDSVAQELKAKGYADAQHFEPATILFSDFKSFTEISGELSADELVRELNVCFKAFDDIMTKFGIEKIKTIGDSYMAAGGVPGTNKATPSDVIKAGIEMQHFVTGRKKDQDAHNLPAFEMRVGIHSGPVVAGIVGVKKFQYDVWGDTVNIASRMESNSEVGEVNISEATYMLVKEDPSFSFTSRGMITVKGKGGLEMYFVRETGQVLRSQV